jgi:hypothetical protein
MTTHQLELARPPSGSARLSYAEADQGMLLGLYHGYDQARLALAKLVARYGTEAQSEDETRRHLWARSRRSGFHCEIFDPPGDSAIYADGINRGAHSAALSAFAAMSEQAEELLRHLRERWPHLREDAGGPLPAPFVPTEWD